MAAAIAGMADFLGKLDSRKKGRLILFSVDATTTFCVYEALADVIANTVAQVIKNEMNEAIEALHRNKVTAPEPSHDA